MYETCCFTGSRPIKLFPYDRAKAYERSSYIALRDELQIRIAQLCGIGVETFLSGCAQGVDQIAFWAVYHVKKQYPYIRNVVCLPFESYGSQWSGDGAFGQSDLKKILELADEVHTVTDGQPNSSDVPKALFERNHYMVDHSDMVLGVSPVREFLKGDGGTAECLRYAKQQGKAIRVLHPTDRELTRFEILRLKPWER